MSNEDRLAKKEFRKRGPGKRNVQVDTLKIVSKSGTKSALERESNNLKSVLLKNEDIENMPRFRRRTTLSGENTMNMNSNETNPSIDEADASKIYNTKKLSLAAVKTERNRDPKHIEKLTTRTNEDLDGDDMQYGDESDQDAFHEDSYTPSANDAENSTQESVNKPVKRRRGRPKKMKVEDIVDTPKIKRKVGRPRRDAGLNLPKKKNIDTPRRSTRILRNDIPSYRMEDDQESNRIRPRLANPKRKSLISSNDIRKPISLSKTKVNETQKPMYINTERIITNEKRDKRLRVNTLDVLKHLIENFNPVISESKIVNESLIHNEFKNHALHHLGYLFDAHANINDISLEINEIQKKKSQLRSKIFEIKKNHADIGSELNKIRSNYQDERLMFKNFNKMTNRLHSLSNVVNGNESDSVDSLESSEEMINNGAETIDRDIITLSKIVNPNSGMLKKLFIINNKLNKIDSELS